MIRLNIIDRDGGLHEEQVMADGTLMEALRELDYGVAAVCGGLCFCATCHVYIASEWKGRISLQQTDERDLVAELRHRRDESRLSCQIRLSSDLDGLQVTLAPEE